MSSLYKIVVRGIAPSADRAQAITAFAKTFKLPADKVEAILSKPTVLKKDIDAAKAKTFQGHLKSIGVLVDIKPMAASGANPFQAHIDNAQAAEEVQAEEQKASEAKRLAAAAAKQAAQETAKEPSKEAPKSAATNPAPAFASGGLSLVEEPETVAASSSADSSDSSSDSSSANTQPSTTLQLQEQGATASSSAQSVSQNAQQGTQQTTQQNASQNTPQDKDALVYDDPIELGFEFTGDGFEYFKIWIVNILLTIVTLGIYSPWAKVRDNRYFYANTFLDEQNFEYHADPKKILIGRIILVAMVLLLGFLSSLSPVIALFLGLFWAIALPFFIHQGIRFKLAYSSYRNVRFHFQKNLKDSYMSYLALPVASAFTLYILYPFAIFKQRKFLTDNAHFGTSQFTSDFTAGEVYKICFITVAGFIVSIFLGSTFFSASLLMGHFSFMSLLTLLIFLLIPAACYWFYYISMRNLVLSSTSLDMNSLYSDVDFKHFIFIKATNYLGIIFSLGLFYPWARVRLAKFLAANTFLNAMENLNNYKADASQDVNATGSEVTDYIDFDFGF